MQHGDNAQQCFSSDKATTLHLSIPALEALHKAWSSRAERSKYIRFAPALTAAYTKIDKYYGKMTETAAYIITMVLDLREKVGYFKKHWSPQLLKDVIKCAEDMFKTRYLSLHSTQSSSKPSAQPVKPKIKTLLRELSDDEDDIGANVPGIISTPEDPNRPWLGDFRAYLDVVEHVPEGWTTTSWWGLNAHRYPVWGLLARDYLSIMASSVSSERAFSQGGITISKRRSRLKGDIVEALQVFKCSIRQDLLFPAPAPSSIIEAGFDEIESKGDEDEDEDEDEADESWDGLFIEEDDDDPDL